MKYRKKPVVIDAILLSPSTTTGDITAFFGGEEGRNIDYSINERTGQVRINTLEGTMTAQRGDWLIKGVKGEFYPCKPDVFDETYEPA